MRSRVNLHAVKIWNQVTSYKNSLLSTTLLLIPKLGLMPPFSANLHNLVETFRRNVSTIKQTSKTFLLQQSLFPSATAHLTSNYKTPALLVLRRNTNTTYNHSCNYPDCFVSILGKLTGSPEQLLLSSLSSAFCLLPSAFCLLL